MSAETTKEVVEKERLAGREASQAHQARQQQSYWARLGFRIIEVLFYFHMQRMKWDGRPSAQFLCNAKRDGRPNVQFLCNAYLLLENVNLNMILPNQAVWR